MTAHDATILRLRELEAEVARLREALAFYADPETWKRVAIGGWGPGISRADGDGGDKAQEALNDRR